MKIHSIKNVQLQKKGKQGGFTLIELMLVIAGAIALIGIGLVIYRQVQGSTGALGGSSGLLQISSGVKQLYPNPNFQGIDAATLISTGKAPANMVNGTALVDSWGGAVTIDPANYNGGTNNAFTVTFNGVPSDACNSMAAAAQNNFAKISVGAGTGTVVKDDSASPPVVYSVATVATACANASNVLAFTST